MISNITIQQFATGDRRAFEAVFRHYYPKVRGFLVGMLKNEADAEDVAQTVFIRLWTKRERLTRSEEHTSELQSRQYLVCRLLLEKKKKIQLHYHCHCTRVRRS